jgi:hypothetical protein
MAREWQHVYVDIFVQAAKEKLMVGEVIGRCLQQLWCAVVFDDGHGMRWCAVVCGCVALPPCGCKAGSKGG